MATKLRRCDARARESTATQLLSIKLGGQKRLARLRAVYKSARPRRVRGGLRILTADEVFRHEAKEDGFSDEDVTRFIDHLEL